MPKLYIVYKIVYKKYMFMKSLNNIVWTDISNNGPCCILKFKFCSLHQKSAEIIAVCLIKGKEFIFG